MTSSIHSPAGAPAESAHASAKTGECAPVSALQTMRAVIEALLAPNGCPWDKEQTPLSLCDYVLEEAHELVDAIRHGKADDAREELGDVLFLLAFIATLYAQQGGFTLDEAIAANADKMIRRHPHVFAGTVFDSREEQLADWERIKRSEKADDNGTPAGVYSSLPKNLPPLLKAYRIHSKAARAGFTWESDAAMQAHLLAEKAEFEAAVAAGDDTAMAEEFGDYLFTLTEYGRRLGLKANACLDVANTKFLARYKAMERLALERGLSLDALDMAAKNALWEEVKKG